MGHTTTLSAMAVDVLTTADGRAKTALSRRHAAAWFAARTAGTAPAIGTAAPPDRPARPDAPALLAPRDVPRRRPGTPAPPRGESPCCMPWPISN